MEEIHRAHNEAVSYFNKIVRATCMRCPNTGQLFHPIGFRGLVAHLMVTHPKDFWEGKIECLA